jgi:hypothetical protein
MLFEIMGLFVVGGLGGEDPVGELPGGGGSMLSSRDSRLS